MDLLRTLPVGGVSLNNAPKKNIMAVALEDVPSKINENGKEEKRKARSTGVGNRGQPPVIKPRKDQIIRPGIGSRPGHSTIRIKAIECIVIT